MGRSHSSSLLFPFSPVSMSISAPLSSSTDFSATSLNFILGFGGIYQFHHAVFYGVGAYGTALMLTKTGFPPWLGLIVGPLVAAFLSLIMGLICIRLSKLYFGMLQISLGSLVWAVIYRWYSFTGGDDGIHGIPVPDLISDSTGAYYFALVVTALSFFVIYRILKSPFGSVLQGIRDNPIRSEMIGVNVKRHQLAALVIAGFFAGVAGVLFVVVDTTVFPDMLFWTLSMEVMIMCPLGRLVHLHGPPFGCRPHRGAPHLHQHLYGLLGPLPGHYPHDCHILPPRRSPGLLLKEDETGGAPCLR